MAKQPNDARDPNQILAEIRRAGATREAELAARYNQLVLDTAAGRAGSDQVQAELKALGKDTPRDMEAFTTAVQRVVRRQELEVQVKAGREAAAERRGVEQQLDAAQAERDEMTRRFDRERLQPLQERLEQLRDADRAGSDARQELERDAGPELNRHAEELDRRRDQAAAAVEKLKEAIGSWRRAAARGDATAPATVEKYERELPQKEAELAEVSRQAAEARAALLLVVPPALPAGGPGAVGRWGG